MPMFFGLYFFKKKKSTLGITCNMSQVLDSRGFASPSLPYQQYGLPFANTHCELFNKNRGWPCSSKSELLPGKGKVSSQSSRLQASQCCFEQPDFLDSTNKKATQSNYLHAVTDVLTTYELHNSFILQTLKYTSGTLPGSGNSKQQ